MVGISKDFGDIIVLGFNKAGIFMDFIREIVVLRLSE